MMTCAPCNAAGRFHVEATQPHPARRPGWVCDTCADDIYAAMEAHWELIAKKCEDA